MTETTNQPGLQILKTKMLMVTSQLDYVYKVMETLYFIMLKEVLFGVLELTMDNNHNIKERVSCAD